VTLRLPKFSYVAAHSVDEAVSLLSDHGPSAMVVAGGTDVYPNMKRRVWRPEVLIGLRGVKELRGIGDGPDGGLRLGASTTLTEVATSQLVRERYPALAGAAYLISTPQLRNMGTIGGNVCLDTRCFYYDQSAFWRKALGYCMKAKAMSAVSRSAAQSAWRPSRPTPCRRSSATAPRSAWWAARESVLSR